MSDLTYSLIGRRLRNARTAVGFTQKEVAGYLNIAREMISYFENGSREIDMIRLSQLADLYGRSLTSFLAREAETGDVEVAIQFRSGDLGLEDVKIVAWASKFTRNLYVLNALLKGNV